MLKSSKNLSSMGILKSFLSLLILQGILFIDLTSGLKKCTKAQIKECKKPFSCPAVISNTTCTFDDYESEHCDCCKRCPYPPPITVSCSNPKKPKSGGCSTTTPAKASCTDDQYIEEMCNVCRRCPYPPRSMCPKKVCTELCIAIKKKSCTYDEYEAEDCQCCKQCPYPPPRPLATCPPPGPPEPCAFYKLEECTPDEYIAELCGWCAHCPYGITN